MSKLTPAQKVAAYIQLRDYKKSAEDEFKKSMKRVFDGLEKLEAELLDDLNQSGANSLSCDSGTVYKNEQVSASIQDHDAFRGFCVDNNLWDAMDIKANKTFLKEYMEAQGVPLPGLKVTKMFTVGVRRS